MFGEARPDYVKRASHEDATALRLSLFEICCDVEIPAQGSSERQVKDASSSSPSSSPKSAVLLVAAVRRSPTLVAALSPRDVEQGVRLAEENPVRPGKAFLQGRVTLASRRFECHLRVLSNSAVPSDPLRGLRCEPPTNPAPMPADHSRIRRPFKAWGRPAYGCDSGAQGAVPVEARRCSPGG